MPGNDHMPAKGHAMALTLVIGNKAYSSWSLRPWIAMKVKNIPFEEKLIPLYTPETRERLLQYSPTAKVPLLIDGDMRIWESLAILDHLADRFPDANLWPAQPAARAHARAISSEMHAGFAALRSHCPMNLRRRRARTLTPEVEADIARIDQMWTEARERFGKGGPFLLGAFSAADAMYAPVATRIVSYELPVGRVARQYVDAIMDLPAFQEWKAAGIAEPWEIPGNDPD
jgi:glutathione S-transferase